MDPLKFIRDWCYESDSMLTLTVGFYEAAGCNDKYDTRKREPMLIGYFKVVREYPPFEGKDTHSWFFPYIGAEFLGCFRIDRDGEICSVRPVCMVGKSKVTYGKFIPLECIELI